MADEIPETPQTDPAAQARESAEPPPAPEPAGPAGTAPPDPDATPGSPPPGDEAAGEAGEGLEEPPPMSREEVRAVLEALTFASREPITPRQISQVLVGVDRDEWQAALEELRADYARPGRGLQLVDVAGGFQITTRPEYNDAVRELLDPRAPTRLSVQALETLAVIAYKQPVTFPEIIELRGVKSGGVIKTLLEKRLIRIVGRKEVVGRPMLYGTTKQFLLHFGLKDLTELPKVEEFAEVLGEEVDVAGLKRAIESPTPTDVPLAEEAAPEAGPAETAPVADQSPSAPPDDPEAAEPNT